VIEMDLAAFEELARRALEELPREFAERLENIAVVLEEEPDPEDLAAMGLDPESDGEELFGIYQGVPLSERGSSYSELPDRIVIYRGPILRACETRQEVAREVRDTVVHELGHYFGLDDDEMPY
jgi:predicted Zn-dependent protease with MMP-like domain